VSALLILFYSSNNNCNDGGDSNVNGNDVGFGDRNKKNSAVVVDIVTLVGTLMGG
jgi:hypothetical protein